MTSVPNPAGAGSSPTFLGDEPAPAPLCPTDDAVREYRRLRRLGVSQVAAGAVAAGAQRQLNANRMRRVRAARIDRATRQASVT